MMTLAVGILAFGAGVAVGEWLVVLKFRPQIKQLKETCHQMVMEWERFRDTK